MKQDFHQHYESNEDPVVVRKFSKTMENLRKQCNVELVTDEKKLLKLASKLTYISSNIFNENLVAVHKIKEFLTLKTPAYVGMCILDLSETLTYDFHHNYIKSKYGDKAKLLFTDTDSLTYKIKADDVYQDFCKIMINSTITTMKKIALTLIKPTKSNWQIQRGRCWCSNN